MKSFKSEYISLFRLGLPVLVTQVGIIVVSFADTLMIGRYGTDELAAAAFVNSVFMVAVVMQIGFAAGITPLVGALFSRRDFAGCGACLKSGLTVNTLVSLAFTTVMGAMYFFLDRFGQPAELLPLIRPYYLIVLASLLPLSVFNACQQTANGSTDTATPMWIILGGNILNICGNWMLIYGKFGLPELGLTGAGLSTLFCRIAMAVTILVLLRRMRRYRDYRAGMSMPLRRDRLRKVWATSYPVMIQSGVECFLWSLGAVVCGEFGKLQLAGYQVVNTIGQLGFMIYMSFSTATSIRVANSTGLNDFRAIRRISSAGLHLCLALGTMSSALFLIWGRQLTGFFTEDQAVVMTAMQLIVPLVLYQYCDAVQLNYANVLRGMSVVKPLLYISLICYLGLGVPTLYFLSKGLGLQNVGVYYSFSVALLAAALMLWLSYRRAIRRMESSAGMAQE